MCIDQFFNNASVGSFLGAFFAFFLVVATDSRRSRKKKKMITKQIELNRIIIQKKKETVANHLKNIHVKGNLYPGKMLPFQIDEIKTMSLEVLNLFKPEEKLALDSICYHMFQTDELLNEVDDLVSKFIDLSIESKKYDTNHTSDSKSEKLEEINVDLQCTLNLIETKYKEVLINIDNIDSTTRFYIKKEYNKILTGF